METTQIDIKKVIENKNKKLARRLPSFVYALIEKFVHLKEINEILQKYGDLSGAAFAEGALNYLDVSGRVKYTHEPAKNRRYLFVSNHPLGGLDGLIFINEISRRFGPSKFIVNDFLFNIKPLQDIFIPVNKTGKTSRINLENIRHAYSAEYNICNFPAGLCSRLLQGKIADPPWHKNFVREAAESGRDIVPLFFSGRNSMAFYRLAKLRKFLGIKFNIEMLFLPHELFKQKGASFDMIIGEPITAQEIIESGKSAQEWCDYIREKVYEYGSSYSTGR